MKKQIFAIAAVAVALVMGLTGCSKDDPSSPRDIASYPTGAVTGIAHATLDGTSSTLQYAPAGTKIFLTITYAALTGEATQAGSYSMVTTVTDNKGAFAFNGVPTKNGGVTATITGDSFTALYQVNATTRETRKYPSGTAYTTTATIMPNGSSFVMIDYGAGTKFE